MLWNWVQFQLSVWYPVASQVTRLQCRRHKRHRFDPWVRKIPWRRAWKSIPVFWPEESHGQRSLLGYSPKYRRVGHDWSDSSCTHDAQVWTSVSTQACIPGFCPVTWQWEGTPTQLQRMLVRDSYQWSSSPKNIWVHPNADSNSLSLVLWKAGLWILRKIVKYLIKFHPQRRLGFRRNLTRCLQNAFDHSALL